MLSILAPIIVLLSPVHAWVATEYVEIAVIGSKGDSYTATSYLRPTAAVTPYSTSTSTDNDNGDQLTLIQLLLSGTNLPVTVPSVSTPTGTEFVSTIYYAPATITAPPTCTGTKFSYGMCSASLLIDKVECDVELTSYSHPCPCRASHHHASIPQ
jgi:hypothetical protein